MQAVASRQWNVRAKRDVGVSWMGDPSLSLASSEIWITISQHLFACFMIHSSHIIRISCCLCEWRARRFNKTFVRASKTRVCHVIPILSDWINKCTSFSPIAAQVGKCLHSCMIWPRQRGVGVSLKRSLEDAQQWKRNRWNRRVEKEQWKSKPDELLTSYAFNFRTWCLINDRLRNYWFPRAAHMCSAESTISICQIYAHFSIEINFFLTIFTMHAARSSTPCLSFLFSIAAHSFTLIVYLMREWGDFFFEGENCKLL